jgi:hypothetical protein
MGVGRACRHGKARLVLVGIGALAEIGHAMSCREEIPARRCGFGRG